MLPKSATGVAGVALCVALFSCTTGPSRQERPPAPSVPPTSGTSEDRRVLAGEWEYEDGAVVTLTLDEQGNGTYAWKDGRFETTALSDHTWRGLWFQRENDREGGFAVQFSPDFSGGDGRWWYTRIGTDRTPTQKGGTFRLTRKSPVADAGLLPTVP